MAKLIHLIVESCEECPYKRYECANHFCEAGDFNLNSYKYEKIHKDCPLQTY